jgi:hypothetical protein
MIREMRWRDSQPIGIKAQFGNPMIKQYQDPL